MIRTAFRTIPLIILSFAAFPASAENASVEQWQADKTAIFKASDINLNDFIWLARPIVIFADSPNDPNFRHQLDLLAERTDDLAARDVLLITDADPNDASDIRQKLRPRGFQLVLIDKDGRVALRKPAPWSIRELGRSIDKSPLRQQEIEDRRTIN